MASEKMLLTAHSDVRCDTYIAENTDITGGSICETYSFSEPICLQLQTCKKYRCHRSVGFSADGVHRFYLFGFFLQHTDDLLQKCDELLIVGKIGLEIFAGVKRLMD